MKEWRLAEIHIRQGRGENPEHIARQMDIKVQTVKSVLAGTYRKYRAGDDKFVILDDVVLTLRELAERWITLHNYKYGIKQAVSVLRKRVSKGYEIEEVLSTPPLIKDPRRNRILTKLRKDPWPVERVPSWERLSAMLVGRI